MSVRIRGTSASVAGRISRSIAASSAALHPDADEGFGDLDGIRRSPFEQVVRHAPVSYAVILDPDPPDVGSRLASRLQRRGETVRVAGEDDAGRLAQDFENFGQTDIAARLDVDALGVAGVDGDAYGGREDGEVGHREDLARLLPHLLLLGGADILPYPADERYGVADNGLREGVLPAVLERLDAATGCGGDRLVGGDYHLLDTELADQGCERDYHLDR